MIERLVGADLMGRRHGYDTQFRIATSLVFIKNREMLKRLPGLKGELELPACKHCEPATCLRLLGEQGEAIRKREKYDRRPR